MEIFRKNFHTKKIADLTKYDENLFKGILEAFNDNKLKYDIERLRKSAENKTNTSSFYEVMDSEKVIQYLKKQGYDYVKYNDVANTKTSKGRVPHETIASLEKGIEKQKQYAEKVHKDVKMVKGEDLPTPKKIGKGEFGDIFEGVKGAEAEQFLIKNKGGEVKGAYTYKGQDVDLMRGEYDGKKGYGLAKIHQKHPEVLGRIQELLDTLPMKELRGDRIILANDKSLLVLSQNWKGKDTRWVVTAYDIAKK